VDRFNYKKTTGITALSASLSDFRYKKHAHQEYAIGVTLRGAQQYHLDGSTQTSYQNGVMLFHPEQPHDGMSRDESGIDYVMLYIEPDIFLDALNRKNLFYFKDSLVYNDALRQKIMKLSAAVLRGTTAAACDDLLVSLARAFQPNVVDPYLHEETFIQKTKEMIHNVSSGVISLDAISAELEVSKFQLIRLFKASEGITPYQYFLNCKVEKAKQIIEETKDVYSAVAGCSFVDLTHMNKHFVCRYGITPFEYLSCVKN